MLLQKGILLESVVTDVHVKHYAKRLRFYALELIIPLQVLFLLLLWGTMFVNSKTGVLL